MKQYKWSVRQGTKVLNTGTVTAASEKEAMEQVLLDNAEGKVADECYTVTVGKATTTSFGDEFPRSARAAAHGVDTETQPTTGGYLYEDPTPKDFATGAGSDTPIGHALRDDGIYRGKVASGQSIPIGSPVRVGASGMVHPPVPKFDDCPATIDGSHDWFREDTGEERCKSCGKLRDRVSLKYAKESTYGQAPTTDNKILLAHPKAGHLERIIRMKGFDPADVVQVDFSPMMQSVAIEGRYFRRDGQQMYWRLLISDYELQHLP